MVVFNNNKCQIPQSKKVFENSALTDLFRIKNGSILVIQPKCKSELLKSSIQNKFGTLYKGA